MDILIVVLIGMGVTLQAGLNRSIAGEFGFPASTLMNNTVIVLVSLVLFLFAKFFYNGNNPIFKTRWPAFSDAQWWWVVPGICGFAIVFGAPYLISKIGAAKVFLCLILGQMIGSVLWDLYVEKLNIPMLRWFGLVLSTVGAMIVVLSK